ncbi:hypothetical protein BCR34DRAFT_648465 [Clohesyomyces aquaticus]|uniref:Uncharacterized protein n=1 Tax=Clohesyomyces aquaticus TaxID=1231657 RepID=A0A1Y2A9B1_9PLEO|nr:hypothetical protein BCR34DRAFT_648465 [Clohesyomyces aquaticus]
MYPAMLQAARDHDVELLGLPIADFSRFQQQVLRVILFGSVRSREPYGSMRPLNRIRIIEGSIMNLRRNRDELYRVEPYPYCWKRCLLMTTTNAGAVSGATAYGTNVSPSKFDPTFSAYNYLPGASSKTITFNASSLVPASAFIESVFSTAQGSPYNIEFYKNYTNQPSFADGKTCDDMIRLFNTSLSAPSYAPVWVRGFVKVKMASFDEAREWS